MKVVTICGSMKFFKEMDDISQRLELEKNYCVIPCINFSNPLSPSQQRLLGELHYKKIDISDAIYVANINGYIGESCRKEIEYAKSQNKEIIYHVQPNKN